jgi:hypothetical protein
VRTNPPQDLVIDRPLLLLAVAVANAFATVYMALRLPSTMRTFRETFAALGTAIDPATRFVLSIPNVWWAFAIAAVAVATWIILRPRATHADYRSMRMVLSAVITATLLAFGFAAFAIYSPLFRLSATA